MGAGDYPQDELHGRLDAGAADSMSSRKGICHRTSGVCFWQHRVVVHRALMHRCSLDGSLTFSAQVSHSLGTKGMPQAGGHCCWHGGTHFV